MCYNNAMKNKFKKISDWAISALKTKEETRDLKKEFIEFAGCENFIGNAQFEAVLSNIKELQFNGFIKGYNHCTDAKCGEISLSEDEEKTYFFSGGLNGHKNNRKCTFLLFTKNSKPSGLWDIWNRWEKDETIFITTTFPENSKEKIILSVVKILEDGKKHIDFYDSENNLIKTTTFSKKEKQSENKLFSDLQKE